MINIYRHFYYINNLPKQVNYSFTKQEFYIISSIKNTSLNTLLGIFNSNLQIEMRKTEMLIIQMEDKQ